jgi:hypothetical protein
MGGLKTLPQLIFHLNLEILLHVFKILDLSETNGFSAHSITERHVLSLRKLILNLLNRDGREILLFSKRVFR